MTFLAQDVLLTLQTQLGAMARLVAEMPLDEFRAHWDHLDAVGPMVDPTAYRKGMDDAQRWKELGQALVPFQHAARKMMAALGQAEAKKSRLILP